MLSSLVHNPCEISLHLVSDDVFIRPPPPNSEIPGDDKTIRGLVELKCPSERQIQGVRVVLQGIQTLAIPETTPISSSSIRWEEKIMMEKTVEITSDGIGGLAHSHKNGKGKGKEKERNGHATEEGIHLDKGIHGFEFAFIIPASSPPFERSRHGRVRYIITATALGAGRGRSHVQTWREVFIILHVSPDGGPTPLDIQYHDVHEALGLLSVTLTAASLTVGGTANLMINHPDPPPGLNVHVARVFVEQTFELYSEARKGWVKLPVEKIRLWEKGYMPYKNKTVNGVAPAPGDALWLADPNGGQGTPGRGAGPGPANISPFGLPLNGTASMPSTPGEPTTPSPFNNGYKIRSVVRLPDDNVIRPSTVRGSRADIRVSHELGVEIFFSRIDVLDQRPESDSFGKPKVQVFSMRRATVIPSCCCTFDTIHLPPYSLESPSSSRPSSPTPPTPSRRSSASGLNFNFDAHLGFPTSFGLGSAPNSRPGSNPNSRPGSRESSPTRQGRRSRASSRERSEHPTRPGGRHHGGLSGLSALTPRTLPKDAPWANTNIGNRSGTSHSFCNCGKTTEELTEAEQRLLEGAPTAPGAWIDEHDDDAVPPPWTPPSRPGSPVSGWHHGIGNTREGCRPRGKLAEIESPLASP